MENILLILFAPCPSWIYMLNRLNIFSKDGSIVFK